MTRVLLLALSPGLGGMHLPRSLAARGVQVSCLAHPGSVLGASRYLEPLRVWPGADRAFLPLREVVWQLAPLEADLIIPVDETSFAMLDGVLAHVQARGASHRVPTALLALVERSIGQFNDFSRFGVRRLMADVVTRAGIPAPVTVPIDGLADAQAFAARHGYPLVIKTEYTSAGTGVSIVEDAGQLEQRFAAASAGERPDMAVAQTFCEGRLAMHTVFAWRGRVRAGVGAVQLHRRSARPTAPSSAVRLLARSPMAGACAAFVAAAGLSGFHSFDFILPPTDAGSCPPGEVPCGSALVGGTCRPLMIEHNPRPIVMSHLGDRVGSDLIGALLDCLAGSGALPRATDCRTSAHASADRLPGCHGNSSTVLDIAFFPDEWHRDPASPLLSEAFHDVPWDDPGIVRQACTFFMS